ncbi:hypothetical protein B0J11DRAFT_582236 [Dendryphion nanum]|uniref:Rhodopsin domain-containing protein n=1 Tax=Dendryphion nanum TaxID=256645 RepID=A0A9P9DIQ8_9PLEO|nr:hypothetical protein B0J11DRAFT_582236 [Dendryphion nanum]
MALDRTHASRQLNAYTCLFITFAAAAITLASRLIARRLTRLRLWYDDYLAIMAFLFAGVWAGLTIWWLQLGLGLYLDEIPIPDHIILEKSRLILWNIELFYAFSLAFSKFAILAFYWRMFKTSDIKIPIKVLIGCTVIWLILRTFLAIFHCVPVQKFWQVQLDGVCNINDSKFFFGTVLTHLVIDVAILALPVIEVQKLKLPLSQRLGISGMFLFGIFVCVASVVVLYYSIQYDADTTEMPWNIAPIIIWASVEVNLAIVSGKLAACFLIDPLLVLYQLTYAACLPMLRPIYLIILRRPLTKNASSGSQHLPRSLTVSHKMATLTAYKETVVPKSDSESTHQLAVTRGDSISSNSEYNPSSNDGGHGNSTVIMGSAGEASEAPQRDRGGSWAGMDYHGMGGIVVTSETTVKISNIA